MYDPFLMLGKYQFPRSWLNFIIISKIFFSGFTCNKEIACKTLRTCIEFYQDSAIFIECNTTVHFHIVCYSLVQYKICILQVGTISTLFHFD